MAEFNSKLPVIENGERLPVLFLGNGINRLFSGASWDEIILDRAEKNGVSVKKEQFEKLPVTMQIAAAEKGHVKSGMSELAGELLKIPITLNQREFTKTILTLPVNQLITANYSYEIEDSVCPAWNQHKNAAFTCYSAEKATAESEMLNRYTRVTFDGTEKDIWHIHGQIYRPSSIIMGHYYYGKVISYAQKHVAGLMRSLGACRSRDLPFRPNSWIDYFMLGDVYMLGFSMDLSEMDIWWLVCCKQIHFPETKIHFFARKVSDEKAIMMDTYGIKRHEFDLDYNSFYPEAISSIKEMIERRGD